MELRTQRNKLPLRSWPLTYYNQELIFDMGKQEEKIMENRKSAITLSRCDI